MLYVLNMVCAHTMVPILCCHHSSWIYNNRRLQYPPWYNPTDHLSYQFLSLLSSFNLTQHVIFPTHNINHTFDLVISSSDTSLAPSVSTTLCSPSDHFPVFTELSVNSSPLPPPTSHSFRRLHWHRLFRQWPQIISADHQSSRLSRLSVNGIQ